MSIEVQQLDGGQTLVRVNGRIDQSQSPQLESTLSQLLQTRGRHIIIDLSDANYINSGGLRCLVTAWRQAKQNDGTLVLCQLNSKLMEIFQMVGFDKVFNIYPSVVDAQDALSA